MQDLLYLVHRIPFPPRKGDKVRSYHFLKHLSRHYRVHLASFIDDAADLVHTPVVRELCASATFERLRPRVAKAASLRGLLTGEALTVKYFSSSRMSAWVRETMTRHQIRRVLVFSSSMAPMIATQLAAPPVGLRTVLDFVDVDSEKWRSYGSQHPGLTGSLYRREGKQLLAFERAMAQRFDASIFVTAEEAALFRERAPESAARIDWVRNGVDAQFFQPSPSLSSPYRSEGPVGVFTGAMDYKANVDAVQWFVEAVMPQVRAKVPNFRFYIVGANPASSVRRLERHGAVVVTGTVDDVRPYIAHASVALAPLQVARGVQNKVLEAMAMARPVVATSGAIEGIDDGHGLHGLVADDAGEFADRVVGVIAEPERANALGRAAREFVCAHYDWAASTAALIRLLEAGHAA